MFDIQKIQNAAIGLVGFRPQTGLSASLSTSRSGLTFEGGSGLVRVANIQAVMDDPTRSLDDELTELVSGAFVDVLNSVFSKDDHLAGGLLFDYETEWTTKTLSGFVGYEIDTLKNSAVSLVINKLMFGGATGTVNLKLFNSQMNPEVSSKALAAVAGNTITEQVNWLLNNRTYGGKWYLGYFTSDLTSQPIAVNRNFSNYQSDFGDILIQPIIFEGMTAWPFDSSNLKYVSYRYGLNIDVSVYDDYTNLILANEQRFAKALQLMVAVKVADMAVNSTQFNRVESLSRANAVFALDGNKYNKDYPEHTGLLTQIKAEIKRLKDTYFPMTIQRKTL